MESISRRKCRVDAAPIGDLGFPSRRPTAIPSAKSGATIPVPAAAEKIQEVLPDIGFRASVQRRASLAARRAVRRGIVSPFAERRQNVYKLPELTHLRGWVMRTNIDIDDTLMAEAQKASGKTTKKDTVEQALRLMIRLRQQQDVALRSANTAGEEIWAGAGRDAEAGDGGRQQRLDRLPQWPQGRSRRTPPGGARRRRDHPRRSDAV